MILDLKKALELSKKLERQENVISNIMDQNTCETIIEMVRNEKGFESVEEAFIIIVEILQRGGTNRRAGNSIAYTVSDKTLTAQEFQKIVQKVKKNATARQFGRAMGNEIQNIAMVRNIPGDLAEQYKLSNPGATIQELTWCSNFQTLNEHCPEDIRDWLVDNYRTRFRN